VRTVDTAATALWLLGVRVPTDWAGRAVATAFLPRAGLSVAAGPGDR
jgi:arylsulfatase A-like enzyme